MLTTFVGTATQTLLVAFILSKGMGAYQILGTGVMIMSLVITLVIQTRPSLMGVSFRNFKTFLIIEGCINVVLGVATLISGTPYIYMVSRILLTPFCKLQEFGLIELQSRIPDRKEFDQCSSMVSSYVAVAGALAAFAANQVLTGVVAFAILCAAEVVNNLFYWAAYKKYTKPVEIEVSSKEVEDKRAG